MSPLSRRRFLSTLGIAAGTAAFGNKGELISAALPADGKNYPLYMLTYDHGGAIGWGTEHFLENLRNAVKWLDTYPSFKIGLDNEAYTYDYFAEHHPRALDELKKYLFEYNGRFGIGTCTYGQPLSCFINEESNIRQIGYALETDRRLLGTAPDIYLMSEHAMHSQIPQILNGFSFKGAIMRTHYMMYGYNPTFNAAIGRWTGIDGSEIPTIPTYEGEGAQFGKTTIDTWVLTRFPSENSRQSLDDFKNMFPHISPLLATRADDAHLRREELVRMYEGREGFQWILLEEILPNFPKPEEPLRTGPNDFIVRMPWGYCGNEIWDTCRKAEVSVLTAERLAAIASVTGGGLCEDGLDAAWKNLLITQHHDIQICGILDDSRKFLPKSLSASESVLDTSLKYIAGEMRGGDFKQLTVFNPNSWARREWTELEVSPGGPGFYSINMERNGKPVPSAVLSADRYQDGSIRKAKIAVMTDVPGLGVCSYAVTPSSAQAAPAESGIRVSEGGYTLSTPYHTVRLNPNGGLNSLRDNKTGRMMFRDGKRSMFFEGIIEGEKRESHGGWYVEPPPGAPWITAVEQGMIGSIPYRFELTFRIDTPRIDSRVTFTMEGEKVGRLSDNRRDSVSPFIHEDKLRLKMFPNMNGHVTGIRDVPFGISETDDRYVQGNYWTAVSDGDKGVAVYNKGAMGSVREEDGGFSVPLMYAMYYIWGTRMLNGEFTYELSVYPFIGHWQKANLHRAALDYNYPIRQTLTGPGSGKYGHNLQPLSVLSENVILSALFTRKGRLYARVYEHEGRKGSVNLEYLPGKAKMTETDLEGNELEAVSPKIHVTPWSFKTIRIDYR